MAILRKNIRYSYLLLSKPPWINKLYWHHIKSISEKKYQELRPELFQVAFPAIQTVWSLTFAHSYRICFFKQFPVTQSTYFLHQFILQSLILQLQTHTELLYISYLMDCQVFSFMHWFLLCLWRYFSTVSSHMEVIVVSQKLIYKYSCSKGRVKNSQKKLVCGPWNHWKYPYFWCR